ncbi:retrovirus-related pol polyprotein from transposon TNT 1-94 [Tanacetum coccineum]
MLEKQPNKVYDPFLKARLGYMNPERLKKAIAAQPKMYDGEMLHSTSLKIDSPDSEETLEDAKESRLKMRNKMVKLNYEKLNALYETFVPQQEPFVEQTYFSIPSTSEHDCSSAAREREVIQLVLWIVDSGCSKHMAGNLSLLRNFVEKFMGIVRFGNDHFATTTGYGDYVQGNLTICHAQILKIRTDNGTEFKNEKLRSFYAKLGIIHHMSIAQTPQQNGVVKRRNRTLVEAARTMLIFSKTLEFLRAEAIATACFTQNRFIVHTRYNKTPYELIRVRKPSVQYFHVFGSLYYPINNHDDLGKMKPKANIGIFIGYSESSRIEGILLQNNQLKIPQLMYPSNYNNNRNGMHGVEETESRARVRANNLNEE